MATLSAAPSDLRIVNPETLYDPAPNGYSHAILVDRPGRLAFIAGQGGETTSGTLAPGFDAQVQQAYDNLAAVLEELGARPDQVVKLTTYVVDHEQAKLDILTKHLVALFGTHLPAQTLVPVPRLALDDMLFEVDATVWLASGSERR